MKPIIDALFPTGIGLIGGGAVGGLIFGSNPNMFVLIGIGLLCLMIFRFFHIKEMFYKTPRANEGSKGKG